VQVVVADDEVGEVGRGAGPGEPGKHQRVTRTMATNKLRAIRTDSSPPSMALQRRGACSSRPRWRLVGVPRGGWQPDPGRPTNAAAAASVAHRSGQLPRPAGRRAHPGDRRRRSCCHPVPRPSGCQWYRRSHHSDDDSDIPPICLVSLIASMIDQHHPEGMSGSHRESPQDAAAADSAGVRAPHKPPHKRHARRSPARNLAHSAS
jgi:hypothetical protein